MESNHRRCLHCDSPLIGRLDKRFCDDGCRTTFNNQKNAQHTNRMRRINHALRRNRAILHSKIAEGNKEAKVPKEVLVAEGFNFKYHTHSVGIPEGKLVYFCYDMGYLPVEEDRYLLVREKEMPFFST